MLKILYSDYQFCPILICDVCGGRIEQASLAAAINPSVIQDGKRVVKEGDVLEVLHAHKGDCHRQAEERFGGKYRTGWTELGSHLSQLTHNVGLTPTKIAERLGLDEEIGSL
jgi:hypothetical protein